MQITILSVIYIFHILFLVSVLALEEYSTLQQKYALESQCRFEAEKYAAEVSDFVLRHLLLKVHNACLGFYFLALCTHCIPMILFFRVMLSRKCCVVVLCDLLNFLSVCIVTQ